MPIADATGDADHLSRHAAVFPSPGTRPLTGRSGSTNPIQIPASGFRISVPGLLPYLFEVASNAFARSASGAVGASFTN